MTEENDEYPVVGELVLATVKGTEKTGTWVTLDEYKNKEGFVHIREISLKWVKNIHDYTKKGNKIVLKVIKVLPERGQIDLSLRRVSEYEKKEKIKTFKQNQRANKLLSLFATKEGLDERIIKRIESSLLKNFGSLYEGLIAISSGKYADKLDVESDVREKFVKIVKENIQPPSVKISRYLILKSFESEGVNTIKDLLEKIKNYDTKSKDIKIEIKYVSAPKYEICVSAPNYKTAEKILQSAVSPAIESIQKKGGIGEVVEKQK